MAGPACSAPAAELLHLSRDRLKSRTAYLSEPATSPGRRSCQPTPLVAVLAFMTRVHEMGRALLIGRERRTLVRMLSTARWWFSLSHGGRRGSSSSSEEAEGQSVRGRPEGSRTGGGHVAGLALQAEHRSEILLPRGRGHRRAWGPRPRICLTCFRSVYFKLQVLTLSGCAGDRRSGGSRDWLRVRAHFLLVRTGGGGHRSAWG